MIYYTGDIHGNARRIVRCNELLDLTEKDTIIILGDVCANYYLHDLDNDTKAELSSVNPTVLCIHGNHECRPEHIPTYKQKEWNGGTVWYEEAFPSLLFAKDGDIFEIEGVRHLLIGGAYSLDKRVSQAKGYGWWEDEQPSEAIKKRVEQQVQHGSFDVILSHTCPFKYRPIEKFLTGYNQANIDDSTERWLDTIEDNANYKAWLCGHWHTDKRIDRMYFLFEGFLTTEQIMRERS